MDDFETTLHRNTSGRWGVQDQTRSVFAHPGVDLGAAHHVYSARWTPTQVCSYLDEVQLGCLTLFDSTDQDMYLTLYEWTRVYGPPPDATTPDVLDMQVDWVRVVDTLEAVAAELDASVPQVAIAWLLARPTVSSVIIGARNEAQLRDNIAAAELRLSPEHIAMLDAASDVMPAYPYYPYRTQAGFARLNPPLT